MTLNERLSADAFYSEVRKDLVDAAGSLDEAIKAHGGESGHQNRIDDAMDLLKGDMHTPSEVTWHLKPVDEVLAIAKDKRTRDLLWNNLTARRQAYLDALSRFKNCVEARYHI